MHRRTAMPFTANEFLDVFAAYNRDLWPLALALWFVTAAVFGPSIVGGRVWVPLAFLLVAMPPRRNVLALVGVVLLVLTFVGRDEGTIWWFARGWTLILSA